MKTATVIQADLEVTPLGTRSRLADAMHGTPVLRRTVDRAARLRGIDGLVVLVPSSQRRAAERMLDGSAARVVAHDAPSPPWRALVRTARKWSLDGWRGGLGGSTCFDEFVDCRLIAEALADRLDGDVLFIPPAAPLFDPRLAERLIDHRPATREEARLAFATTPPGLSGVVMEGALVRELAAQGVPLGWVFSYKPDAPLRDLAFQSCCVEIAPEIRYAAGRLMTDTRRSWDLVEALLRDHPDPDAVTACAWLRRREVDVVEELPREVEIELTTADPYPESVLRPRGSRVSTRGPINTAVVERVVEELAAWDDALIVLGGHGDPLCHSNFEDVLGAIRPRHSDTAARGGVYGVCLRTTAAGLDDRIIELLIAHEVDVLNVVLDAWTPELYAQLQGPSDPEGARLGDVLARLDRLNQAKLERKSVAPIVVPEMAKSPRNVHELDDFHDGWLRKLGTVSIVGASDYAGQFENDRVTSVAPPKRGSCRRLRTRCVVLANGRVTACDQDVHGIMTVGDLADASLRDLWRGVPFEKIRDAHRTDRAHSTPLCGRCDEWHRP